TVTAPPPAVASTVSVSSSFWTFCIRSCICCTWRSIFIGSFTRDLLHPRHASVEPAHDLAHEGIVLRARRPGRGFCRFVLAQPEVDPDVIAEPRAHVRHQLRRLLLRLLVVEPIPKPQHE